MLIDVRIICAHEARDTAQTLRRLLTAEGHKVEVSSGHSSLTQLDAAKTRHEAVIVLWSERAQAAQYPLQWAQATAPERLIELVFCEAPPSHQGRAEMIVFTGWRGQRSDGACWRSLQQRLRAAAKTGEPPKPPPRTAALVLVGFSLAAAAAAVWARFDAQRAPLEPVQEAVIVSTPLFEEPRQSEEAQGGPLTLSEPDDYTPDMQVHRLSHTTIRPIRPVRMAHFAQPVQFEQRNMLERMFGREQRPSNPERSTP